MATQEKFHRSIASENSFCDVVPVNFYNQTVNASSQLKLELDALNGDFAFLAVYIRALNSDTSSRSAPISSLQYIGDTAKVDILDPGSKSVLGNGTGVSMNYLKNFVTPKHFNNRLMENTNVLIVPFGGNCSDALKGMCDGKMRFDGSRYYLSLTPDSAWTSAAYDVTVYGYKYAKLFSAFGKLAITE
jgi:hypothetical protein